MSEEPEAIRLEMDETRNSLTDKISQLEEKVVGTVNDATEGVKQTVETMKEAVQDTVASVRACPLASTRTAAASTFGPSG